MMPTPPPDGYLPLAPGKIASVVTYLEMREPPALPEAPLPDGFEIRLVRSPDLDTYRKVLRDVGEPWLWFSRAIMPDLELAAVLANPKVEIHFLMDGEQPSGIAELDRREFPDIELVAFGLTPNLVGRGLGRAFIRHACHSAWLHRPQRFWLHTCTLDHPKALTFYQRSGFKPYKRAIEVADDPRLTGKLRRTAAPHVPIL